MQAKLTGEQARESRAAAVRAAADVIPAEGTWPGGAGGPDLGDLFRTIFRPMIEDALRPVVRDAGGFLGGIIGGVVGGVLDAVGDAL